MNDKLLNYDQVADRLQISPVTLRRWTMQRRVPFLKIGGAVRFDPSEIDAWIAQQRVEAQRGLNR